MKIVKIKLALGTFAGSVPAPAYRVIQLIGAITINTSKGNFRVGDAFPETIAQELTQNRNYLVTVVPA